MKALTIAQSVEAILSGKLIAYPTEAVWGLGCDPFNAEAVTQLLQLKKRNVEKGLILVAANYQQIEPLLASSVTEPQRLLLQQQDARPTTWLVPFNPDYLPRWISGKHQTVAIRISTHTIVSSLCLAANRPLVSTSANPQGCQPAKHSFQVRRYFGADLPLCRGEIGQSTQPSTIKDLQTGAVIRA